MQIKDSFITFWVGIFPTIVCSVSSANIKATNFTYNTWNPLYIVEMLVVYKNIVDGAA